MNRISKICRIRSSITSDDGSQEGEKRQKGAKGIFEEMLAEIFHSFMKNSIYPRSSVNSKQDKLRDIHNLDTA